MKPVLKPVQLNGIAKEIKSGTAYPFQSLLPHRFAGHERDAVGGGGLSRIFKSSVLEGIRFGDEGGRRVKGTHMLIFWMACWPLLSSV